MARREHERTVVALGGNAIAPGGSGGTAAEQIANINRAMVRVADLVAAGHEVVLTHGNGPQVGNLLVKNELARDVVPPMPLDWCVAQTQATIGFVTSTALERELAARGVARPVVPVVSRVLVDAGDPAFERPTKPIGGWLPAEQARERARDTGQVWAPAGERGWRRVVASPEPRELLDLAAVEILLAAGAVVVAAGGGGIPVARGEDGTVRGVEAVIDKDLAGALLARCVAAEAFVILTDVPGVATGHGTPGQRWLGEVTVEELRDLQAGGEFAAGSMGPKVEAACRFVEAGGRVAVIAALDDLTAAVGGTAGTRVHAGTGAHG